MIALHLDNVSFSYFSDTIFRNLSWEVHTNRCVGLVGPNGCGKSTLLRLIAGELIKDDGFLVHHKDAKIGYLTQDPTLNYENTVWQEAMSASDELAAIEAELNRVESSLGDPEVYGNEGALNRALEEQARLLEQFEKLGGASYEGRIRSTLRKMNFKSDIDLNLRVETLSGGQKKLLGLAKLLVTQPDILLLDEPDNHLDMEGKAFLEELIRGYSGAVVIVSHDRYLLDLVVDEIAELDAGKLTVFHGNYSEYTFEKQAMLLRQQQMFQAQQKEITRLEQSAKRLLMWGHVYDNEKFIKRGQNILKRIERIDKLDKPVLERKRMGLDLGGWRGSNKVLELTDVDKVFPGENGLDDNIVLAGLDMLIWRGQRVGLVGPNGAGKSVLFRLLLGQDEPTGGSIMIGPSVEVGYYSQEHETLDYDRTLIDTVRHAATLTEGAAVSFLGGFLFDYLQSCGPVSDLSGGERSRLQLALLMLSNANFLLLDEPTNNLDIASAEVLEDAIANFEGTVLVISHDRYFLDRVVEQVVEIEDGVLVEYDGGYSDYRQAKAKRQKKNRRHRAKELQS